MAKIKDLFKNIDVQTGLRDGLPIGLGYLSVSFAFGIFTVEQGFKIWQALAISMTNLTSAGQLAGVTLIAALAAFVEIALSQLVINLRYSLMSITLSQKMDKSIKLSDRFFLSIFITKHCVNYVYGNKPRSTFVT